MDRPLLLRRAAAFYAEGQLADAEACYQTILAAAPRDGEALSNRAAVRNATGRHEAAAGDCRAALAEQPGYWPALANLGNALHGMQRHEDAAEAYYAALQANPSHASTWTNLGVALNEMQRMQDSLLAHDTALRLAPQDAQIRTNRAMALLMAGDYAQGFAEFEWRWSTPGMIAHGMAAPAWLGDDPAGRTILIHHEGGFGDTIQFIRYAPLLAARGARVIARVQAPLAGLLARSMPDVTFVTETDPVPAHDLQCAMLSLPHRFSTTLPTVPGATPYLHPCPHKTANRADRLGRGRRLLVGLAWAGAPLLGMAAFRAMNARRSAPLAAFAPLGGVAGVRFVSLQIGGAGSAAPPGLDLADPMGHVHDFDDTAAIIASLDLVIGVDTAVIHLAGALGVPVWVLSRYDACWRWLAGRVDCPWYPTMLVFRQPVAGEWAGPIDQIAARLRVCARTGVAPACIAQQNLHSWACF